MFSAMSQMEPVAASRAPPPMPAGGGDVFGDRVGVGVDHVQGPVVGADPDVVGVDGDVPVHAGTRVVEDRCWLEGGRVDADEVLV